MDGRYDPVTPTGARFCEARVWYIFQQLAEPTDFDAEYYLPYAQGFNLTRRMPLWVRPRLAERPACKCSPRRPTSQVRPKRGLTRADVHAALSSKYEGSWLDPALDVTAGPEHTPYRYNGLTWQLKNHSFVNERIVGTQFTAWHFVASVRGRATPAPLRALLWWGADDHAWAPKVRPNDLIAKWCGLAFMVWIGMC